MTKWIVVVTSAVLALAHASSAYGQVYADRGGAVIVYPYVVVDATRGIDTVLQLSNISADSVLVECAYEDNTSRCVDSGAACVDAASCSAGDRCATRWVPAVFSTLLIGEQPLAWRASTGNPRVPIPSVPQAPFTGALRCVVVNGAGLGVVANVLTGNATLETYRADTPAAFDVAKYNATGIPALQGDANVDGTLTLAAQQEYNACPNSLLLSHLFDGATDPVSHTSRVETTVAVVPCTVDYAAEIPGESLLSYVVFNEFDQRFASQTPIEVSGQLVRTLTSIAPDVFAVGFEGTLTGRTIFGHSGSGLLGLAIERHQDVTDPTQLTSAARGMQGRALHAAGDTIVLFASTPTPTQTPSEGPSATPTSTPTVTPVPPIVGIAIGGAEARPGDTVVVTTSLRTARHDVAAVSNDILFDTRFFAIDPADCAIAPGIGKSLSVSTVRPGQIRVVLEPGPSPDPIVNGPLYSCRVHIAPSAAANFYPLTIVAPAAADALGAQLDRVVGSDGSVTVALVPLAGDVNHDGHVDSADVPAIVAAIFSDPIADAADINVDAAVSAADIVALRQLPSG